MVEVWVTKINLKDLDEREIEEKCREIKKKDDTFKFKITVENNIKYLIVYSQDKDQAYKRGVWIIKNLIKKEGFGFDVFRII